MKSLRQSIEVVWTQPYPGDPFYTLHADFGVQQQVKLNKEYVQFGHADILKHTEESAKDNIIKAVFGLGVYHLDRLEALALRGNNELKMLGRGIDENEIRTIGTELREILRGNGAV